MSTADARRRVLRAIDHEPLDRIPLMYRGLPETDGRLCEHLGLGPADEHWLELIERLGADLFSGGSSLGKYTRVAPKYVGPLTDAHGSSHLDYVWGLKAQEAWAGTHAYVDWPTHPMAEFTSVCQVEQYPSPRIEDFDFSGMALDEAVRERALYSVGKLNHIFMIASRLRGMDRLLMDMAASPAMAEAVIDKVADFAVALNRKSLEQVGSRVDHYVLWDDVAMQNGMMMGPPQWNHFLRKWYETLYADAKQYGLKVFYHCCGSFHPIIPTLIDIGVDILDPVQTSAREMDLRTLKSRYGDNVCWHGGIDVQRLLPRGTVADIRAAVREAEDLFGLNGGIILGPSHEVTPDTPIENILAVYGW
jgi:uroporphyrinogen decarboxylase